QSVIGEEDGGLGSFSTLLRGHRGDAAIILEPTSLAIVPACAGALTFRLRLAGHSTHAGLRTEGVSVIEKFWLFWEALAELEARLGPSVPRAGRKRPRRPARRAARRPRRAVGQRPAPADRHRRDPDAPLRPRRPARLPRRQRVRGRRRARGRGPDGHRDHPPLLRLRRAVMDEPRPVGLAGALIDALQQGEAALQQLVGGEPGDRRDRALALLTIYDLHSAPV